MNRQHGFGTSSAILLLLSAAMLAMTLGACLSDDTARIAATGTILYVSLEGGFYGISGDDGQKYDPLNLPEEFRKDGLRVKFEATTVTEGATPHMWGTVITINYIEKL